MAVFVIHGSQSMEEFVEVGNRTTPKVMAFLVFFSVMFLHWLLARYATAIDLFSTVAQEELRAAEVKHSARGFFRCMTALGYIQVFFYSITVAGYPSQPGGATPSGPLMAGIVFLFLGLLARTRGVIQFLISSRCESLRPRA